MFLIYYECDLNLSPDVLGNRKRHFHVLIGIFCLYITNKLYSGMCGKSKLQVSGRIE